MLGWLVRTRGEGSAPPAKPRADLDRESQARAFERGAILCAACRAMVCDRRSRLEVNGTHVHTFLNPAAVIYKIGCFDSAPGTLPVGEPSDYFSWFPGFRWQVALCRACQTHLGWVFRAEGSEFYGLILECIVEQAEPPS